MATSTKHHPHLRFREHRIRGGRKIVRARESVVRLHLLVKSEATPIKPHQHDYLNMSRTRTITNMLKWIGKAYQASALHKELKYAENGRNRFPQGKGHQLIIQYQIVSPENIHIQIGAHRLSRLCLCI